MFGVREPWRVVWRCGCDQTAVQRSDLPERCPGHDTERADAPEILWASGPQDRALIEINHQCGRRKCRWGTARD